MLHLFHLRACLPAGRWSNGHGTVKTTSRIVLNILHNSPRIPAPINNAWSIIGHDECQSRESDRHQYTYVFVFYSIVSTDWWVVNEPCYSPKPLLASWYFKQLPFGTIHCFSSTSLFKHWGPAKLKTMLEYGEKDSTLKSILTLFGIALVSLIFFFQWNVWALLEEASTSFTTSWLPMPVVALWRLFCLLIGGSAIIYMLRMKTGTMVVIDYETR